jgi:AraC-like DNA-binding protein
LRPDLENAIALLLPHGEARADEISRKLGMSQRTLARRLSEEGLTLSSVLRELKLELEKLFAGRPGDFGDCMASRLSRIKRVHSRIPSMVWEDATPGTIQRKVYARTAKAVLGPCFSLMCRLCSTALECEPAAEVVNCTTLAMPTAAAVKRTFPRAPVLCPTSLSRAVFPAGPRTMRTIVRQGQQEDQQTLLARTQSGVLARPQADDGSTCDLADAG